MRRTVSFYSNFILSDFHRHTLCDIIDYMKDKKDEISRLKRLFQIDKLLRADKKLTLKEIAQKCGVTTRTILRNFETLVEEFGADISFIQNGNRYEYRYKNEKFSLSDISITEEEAFAIQRTRELLKSLPLPKFYERTLKGLESLMERSSRYNRDF